MKVLGILGSAKPDGITAQMLAEVLRGVPTTMQTETIDLNDYVIRHDDGTNANPVLDELEQKMLESDVWVMAAPTYWGGLSGIMKNFLDCMRQRLVRFDHEGGTHPDRFKNKHYLAITNCYTGTVENFVTGVTDSTFRTFDKVLTSGGLIKVNEIVMTNTFGLSTLPQKKKSECQHRGTQLATKQKRDDSTLKRYIQLFFMIAAMALLTMGIQTGIKALVPFNNFWLNYGSFVIIFYLLLAVILHFFTVVKHRRK